MTDDTASLLAEMNAAFAADDVSRVRARLRDDDALRALVNEPLGPFDTPPIVNVRSREMLDVLLDAGADIDARSRWWAGGFGLLDFAAPELAAYAIARGATLTAHAAARLGRIDDLRVLVARDPAIVRARGGDGQTPLHVAGTIEVAAFLLEQGADIDAADVDHESTPAQYMVGDRQPVARYLVSAGGRTDLLMAAALGDPARARRHLDDDPACIRVRVDSEWFPMRDARAGGTIYQWTLGFHASPHQVARKFGHHHVLDLLLERSPPDVALIDACWAGDAPRARLTRDTHGSVAGLSESGGRQIAHAARNNDAVAVGLMLECGWPVAATGQHGATPLHWAAFHGNAGMIATLLAFNPPLESVDADFNSTPLGWAVHGSQHGWYARDGNYGATVQALLRAGAKRPATIEGSQAVQEALRAAEPPSHSRLA